MADNHVVNVLVNLQQRGQAVMAKVNEGMGKLNDNIQNVTTSQKQLTKEDKLLAEAEKLKAAAFGKSNKAVEEHNKQLKEYDDNLEQLTRDEKRYVGVLNSSKTSIGQKADAEKKLAKIEGDRIATVKDKNALLEKATKTEEEHTHVIEKNDTVITRANKSARSFATTYKRVKERVDDSNRALGESDHWFKRLVFNQKESEKSSIALERRLARLGRAMLGLGIATVIIFMQSFVSVLVAAAGEAVALAGSLTFAASVAAGTFVAGISQAIPVVALLAAAMQRVSLIGDALSAQQAARKTAGREEADTAQQAADAHDQVADAQRGVADAQKDLTEARAEARRELQDLILAEREAELAMRGAIISQVDARRALRDAVQEGDIGGIDSARLGSAESKLGVTTARRDLNRARQDAARARAGGVEGMPSVVNATRQLEDAQRALADSHDSVAESASEQTAQIDNLKFALQELTPAERELYRNLLQLKEQFKDTFTPITDILIRSFSTVIGDIEKLIFDNKIVDGFRKLATRVGGALERISGVVTGNRSKGFFEQLLGDSAQNIKPITDAFINLWKVFRNIAEGAAPVLHHLLKLIADETERWADSTTNRGSLTQFFETGLDHLRAWYDLLTSVVSLFKELMDASGGSAIASLEHFIGLLDDAEASLENDNSAAKEFFRESQQGFEYIIDIVIAFGREMIRAFDPDSIRALRDILINVLFPAISDSISIMGGLIKVVAGIVNSELISWALQTALTFSLVKGSVGLLYGLFRGLAGPIRLLIGYMTNLYVASLFLIKGQFKDAIVSLVPALGGFITKLRGMGTAMKLLTVGSVVGLVLTALASLGQALGVFGDDQEEAEVHIRDVTDALRTQEDAIRALRDAYAGIRSSRLAVTQAELAEKEALRQMHKARREFGKDSSEFKQAENNYRQAVLATRDARVRANDAEEDAPKLIRESGEATKDALNKAAESAKQLVQDREALEDAIQVFREGGTPAGAMEKFDLPEDVGAFEDKLTETNKKLKVSEENLDQALENRIQHLQKADRLQENLANSGDDLTNKQKEQRAETRKLNKAYGAVIDTLFGTGKQSSELGRVIKEVTNNVLKSFGADEVKLSVPSAKQVGKVAGTASNILGSLFASGGWIGSPWERGPDDRLIGVAGGEAVLTGHQQRSVDMALAYGNMAGVIPYRNLNDLFAKDKREHKTAGYAAGGVVPIPGFPGEKANPAIIPQLLNMVKRFNLFVTDVYGSGHASIEHTQLGTAADVVPGPGGSWALVDKAVASAVKSGYTPVYYDGRFGSIAESGHGPPSVAGGNAHAHITFLTAAELAGGAGPGGLIGGAIAEQIKRIKIGGPDGPLKNMLQGQSDELRSAANKKISKALGSLSSLGDLGGNVGGGALSAAQVRKIFLRAFGITGVSPGGGNLEDLMSLAHEESTWNPSAANRTPAGIAAGGPKGILQVIGATFAAAAQTARDQHLSLIPTDIWNPLHNAVASIIYQMGRYGDIQAHAPYAQGGMVPSFDQGGVVPGSGPQAVIAHGGETILPTHKFQSGGRADIRKGLSGVRSALHKINRGGPLEKIIDTLTELLREGGVLDDLATAMDFFIAQQSRNLVNWAYKIRHGLVAQIKTHEAIARRTLNQLEEQGKFLNKEMDALESMMKTTRNKLKRADNNADKQKLKAALNNLELRIGELGDRLSENLTSRLEAQAALFEAAIARFEQRIGLVDIRQQILQLQGELSGNIDVDALKALVGQKGDILKQQGNALQREFNKAERRGDKERMRELRQAMLENELALLENTKALKEIEGTLGEVFDFNTTPWQMFRIAVLNGMGGLIPGLQMPGVISPYVPDTGSLGADYVGTFSSGTVKPQNNNKGKGDTNVNITQPMEVADPVALSNAIAFKLKQEKTY